MNRFKLKFIPLLLMALLCATIANAYDFKVDGIYYNINGTEAIVTYRGESYSDYSNEYTGSVIIPSTVSYNGVTYSVAAIGYEAFRGCNGLTSVSIPNSVTSIGNYAFHGCSGLTSMTIPNSVTSIGGYTFSGCSGLTSMAIPNSVTSIGGSAFQECYGLTSVTIPNSVTTIGGSAFMGCCGLTSVTIPNSVTSIGNSAFACCSGLTSVSIPNSVTTIGEYAFSETAWYDNQPDGLVYAGLVAYHYKGTMPNGADINIREGTLGIADGAFHGCSGLTSMTIPNSVTSIGGYTFSGCSGLTSVAIGTSVTSIGYGAFSGCSGLTSVSIPNSVTSIGDYSFKGCSGLTSVAIGTSVTSIGYSAFSYCSGLTSMTIPNSVTSIGNYAFQGCSALDTLNFNAISCADFSLYKSPFYNLNISAINMGDRVEKIPAYFACNLKNLTSVTIPTSVTSIGSGAFYECTNLKSVTSLRPEAVSLPYSAFSGSTYNNATLTVPVGSYYNYKQTDYWSRFSRIQESISVDSIALDCHNLSICVGDVVHLSATVLPADANQQVTWSTSNSAVVSVDSDGTVTGLKVGSATITATACDGSERQASCLVTVLPAFNLQIDTLTHIRGEAAELVEIPISFRNRKGISAVQFDVSLPSSCASFGYPVMRVNESRVTSSHTFSYNKLSDNFYRVLIASPTSQELNDNDGPLVYLNVLLNKSVSTAGDYYISIGNAIAAEPDETRHELENAYGVIRYYYIVGDADGDLSVDIADYNATASKILARYPSPFYSDAADVDANSSINVTDLVGITNISLGIRPITLRYAPRQGSALNLLTCEPLVIAAGEEGEMSLDMDCSFDFAAFQMDVSLPQGLTLTGATLGSDASKLQLATATLPDGSIRLLASSFSDAEVQGNCPELLTLNVKAADDFSITDAGIALTHITFAERNLTSHELDDLKVDLYGPSGISELDDDTRIYVEEGRIIVESPVEGLVVVSDVSGHTREYPVEIGRNEIRPWRSGILIIKMNSQVLKVNMK